MIVKWLAYILCVYILVLSGIPCSPGDQCCMEEQVATTGSGTQPRDNRAPVAPCSPLFACNACHAIVEPQAFVLPAVLPVARPVYVSFYKAHLLSRDPAAIWQPPKC